MVVWLVTVGEPLPTDGDGGERLYRTGILANMLADQGHEVVWWTSTFDHVRKRHRFETDTVQRLDNGIELRLLHGCGYRRNVSLRRVADHVLVARGFSRHAPLQKRPAVILCSLPTLELGVAATRYGRKHRVPVVLDVRDLWPDLILDLAPSWARSLSKALLWSMWQDARIACEGATAIFGTSPRFVEWGLKHAGRARNAYDRYYPFGYVTVAPSLDRLKAASEFWMRRGLREQSGEFVACFFGTMGAQFDLATIIEAARLLEEQRIPIQFVLCGVGPQLETLKKRAEGLANVQFPGWVGAAEIWTLMRMASVGLAPYLDNPGFADNYPNKTIEYLSAGLPIVSSLQGYFTELLNEWRLGVTYNSGSAKELADILASLLRDSRLLMQMSERARRAFRERFEAHRVYGAMVENLFKVTSKYSVV